MAREARCSIAIRGVSISTDAPANSRRPIHNDDPMRPARPPKTKLSVGASSRHFRTLQDRRPRHVDHCSTSAGLEPHMQWWVTSLLDVAKLCQTQAAVAVLIIIVFCVLVVVRWVRGYNRQTLILLRGVAFHMIQNRPPTDDATRLQDNVNWWETEVLKILPRAGAKSDEIARFAQLGAAGNVYHRGMIGGKIGRLDAIIDRLERQG